MSDVRDALTVGAARLAAAGIDTARLDARLLLGFAMELAAENLLVARDMTEDQRARFEALISRRESREPVAYIVGQKEFWSLDFEVGPGVLIPRPETETLIEQALRDYPDRDAALNVADFGTGSGCLLIAFLESNPNATGWGIERSTDALAWAARNVRRHGSGGGAFCRTETGPWRRTQHLMWCSATRPTSPNRNTAVRRRRFCAMSPARRSWGEMTGSTPIGH